MRVSTELGFYNSSFVCFPLPKQAVGNSYTHELSLGTLSFSSMTEHSHSTAFSVSSDTQSLRANSLRDSPTSLRTGVQRSFHSATRRNHGHQSRICFLWIRRNSDLRRISKTICMSTSPSPKRERTFYRKHRSRCLSMHCRR